MVIGYGLSGSLSDDPSQDNAPCDMTAVRRPYAGSAPGCQVVSGFDLR